MMNWIFCLGLVLFGVITLNTEVVNSITCLNCKNIADLSTCKEATVCNANETCYIERVLSPVNNEPVFSTGCKAMEFCKLQLCNKQAYGDANSKKKRQKQNDLTLCSECCFEDSCNSEGCGFKQPVKNITQCFECSEVYEGGPQCTKTVDCDLTLYACSVTNHPVSHHSGAYELGCKFKRAQCNKFLELTGAQQDENVKCCDTTLCNTSPYNRKINKTEIKHNFKCPEGIVRPTTKPPLPPSTTTFPAPTRPPKSSVSPTIDTHTPPTIASSTFTPNITQSRSAQTTILSTVKATTKLSSTSTATEATTETTTYLPKTNSTTISTTIKTTTDLSKTKTTTELLTTKTTTELQTTKSTTELPTTKTKTELPTTKTTTELLTTKTTTELPTTKTTTELPTSKTTTKLPTTTTVFQSTSTTTVVPSTTTKLPTTAATTAVPTTKSTTKIPTTTTVPSTTTTLPTTVTTTIPTTKTTTPLPTTKTTTTTGIPPKTIPPVTTMCAVCSGPLFLCEKLFAPTPCAPPNNYCINSITNHLDGTKTVTRSCGNFDKCYKEYFEGSSDDDKCRNFDGNDQQFLDFSCTFCCTKDNCNTPLHPSQDSLYKPE